MKKTRLLALVALPLLLVGCNNGNTGGTSKNVDLSTEEGWNEVVPEVKKAVKASAPALLDNINAELSFKVPELKVEMSETFAEPDEENVNRNIKVNASNVELSVNAGVKGLSTAQTFNGLVGYANLGVKGSFNVKDGDTSVLDLSINDLGLDAYLKEGIVYADINRVNVEDVNAIIALLPDEGMMSMIKSLVPVYLPSIKEQGGKVYTDLVASMVGNNFAPIKLVDGWEQKIDDDLTVAKIKEALGGDFSQFAAVKDCFTMGSDANHKLIFTVSLDAKAKYAASKDAIYDAYVAALPEGATPMSKTEFFAEADEAMKDIKTAKVNFSVKFDNNYVLNELSADLDLDLSFTRENKDDDGVLESTSTGVIKVKPSLSLKLDASTDVASKLPASFDGYKDIMTIIGAVGA